MPFAAWLFGAPLAVLSIAAAAAAAAGKAPTSGYAPGAVGPSCASSGVAASEALGDPADDGTSLLATRAVRGRSTVSHAAPPITRIALPFGPSEDVLPILPPPFEDQAAYRGADVGGKPTGQWNHSFTALQGSLRTCFEASQAGGALEVEYPSGVSTWGSETGDLQYPRWQLHNARVADQMWPLAVVYPKNIAETAQAVKCASKSSVGVSGQSGRHSYTAYCRSPCVLVNVYHMKTVEIVDKEREVAELGAGLNLGQAYTWLDNLGYTIPGGTCPSVGLAGLTLGGGKGILTRTDGLLIDKLEALDMVLPNGTIVNAREDNYPDLLWLAKGGGGNTIPGIVTAFYFKLVKRPDVITEYIGRWAKDKTQWDAMTGVKAWRMWQDRYLVHADHRLYVRLELHPYQEGDLAPHVMMSFKFIGMTWDEARPYLEPAFEELGQPTRSSHSTLPYIRAVMEGGGIGYYTGPGCSKTWSNGLTTQEAKEIMTRSEPPFCSWDGQFNTYMKYRALVLKPMNNLAIQRLMEYVSMAPYFNPQPDEFWNFYLEVDPLNGFAGSVAPGATAFPWRGTTLMALQVISKYSNAGVGLPDGSKRNPTMESYNYLLIAVLQPFVGTRSYYNYADEDMPGGAVPLNSYFGENRERVLRIRSQYMNRASGTEEWQLLPYRSGQAWGLESLDRKHGIPTKLMGPPESLAVP